MRVGRLGKYAQRIFDGADDGRGAIYIPVHVLAELGEACHSNRVILDLPFEEWARDGAGSAIDHT